MDPNAKSLEDIAADHAANLANLENQHVHEQNRLRAEFEAKLGQQLQQQQQQHQQQNQQWHAELDILKAQHNKAVAGLHAEMKRSKQQHELDIQQLINSSDVTACTSLDDRFDFKEEGDDAAAADETQAAVLASTAIDDEAAPLRLLKIPFKASNDNILQ